MTRARWRRIATGSWRSSPTKPRPIWSGSSRRRRSRRRPSRRPRPGRDRTSAQRAGGEGVMKRYNIRMAGIGGQGVVTASHVLSNGVIIAGGESTLVPFFGSEKRMAPVESYVRIAEGTIYEIGEIIYPNVCMIFHSQVITHGKSYTMPFYSGLKDDGVVVINLHQPLHFFPEEDHGLEEKRIRVYYVPATAI